MSPSVRRLTDVVCGHGEGPAWSPRWAGPRVLDMLAGDIVELRPGGVIARRHVGEIAAIVRARRHAGWIVVTRDRILLADEDSLDAELREGPALGLDAGSRANEGGCDPDGVLHVGSMSWEGEPGRGVMVRVGTGLGVEVERTGLGISNGLAWTADGSRAYFADTLAGVIEEYRWDPVRGLHEPRIWAEVPGGGADGLATDIDGGVWVAQFGGGAVLRFAPTGELSERVELPVRQPTAVAFVGERLDSLLVTTSVHALEDPEPDAGAVFEVVGLGVRGVPLGEFAA
jgi:sugar lactone lactonase YvrE